jgi:hypothetical protein
VQLGGCGDEIRVYGRGHAILPRADRDERDDGGCPAAT